jgi:UDP-N-acetylmuramoyl-tripeptide--D-alanyl-D-alanine ligase
VSADPFFLNELIAWSDGTQLAGKATANFDGVSIDTRSIERGQLFVAIAGPNFDAHEFLPRAARAGAAGLLVERDRFQAEGLPSELPVVGVDDCVRALGAVAAAHRARFEGPLVAITGSSGKTTTKEMCAAILGVGAACLQTTGNLNNEFGLPLTLLRRETGHQRAVVEIGTNHPGEIATLAAIAAPTVAAITNVGVAHIEFLGSRDGIAREKGDIYASLSEGGIAVVNRDDPRVCSQAEEKAPGRIVGFGSKQADVRAEAVQFDDEGGFAFRLITPAGSAPVRVAGLGDTTVINALAAAACGVAAGVPLDEIATGLERYVPPRGRMAQRKLANGAVVIDDSYNANPDSLRVALESLARLAKGGGGHSVAVVGDMGELGDSAESAHRAAGSWVAELGIDFLFAFGSRAGEVAQAAREGGMQASHVHEGQEHEAVAAQISHQLGSSDWVLVKGSRAMHMEKIVSALAGEGE